MTKLRDIIRLVGLITKE